MPLKREQKLWLRADESSPWLPLGAGITRLSSSTSVEKRRWFELGQEASPWEEVTESVKVITLQLHFREDDAAQQLLLNSGGGQLLLKRELPSKNGEIMGFSARCSVEPAEELDGAADEPLTYRIKLRISQEIPEAVKV